VSKCKNSSKKTKFNESTTSKSANVTPIHRNQYPLKRTLQEPKPNCEKQLVKASIDLLSPPKEKPPLQDSRNTEEILKKINFLRVGKKYDNPKKT
jgi:hypothetical protein